jgi:hypothetical protein
MGSKVTFFLGANAPSGFYSLYDQLLPQGEARRVFLLKGGAGCGKSSLMGRAADALEEAGQRVEYIRCSGDPDSLDAVIFPDLGAAIVDATAPHVIEPKLPGAVESYIDLGRFYDHEALAPLREKLAEATEGYQSHYKGVYRRLTAAAQLAEDDRALLTTPALEAKVLKRARGILSREVKKTGAQPGRTTQRFLGAVTCQGLLCRFDTVNALCRKVYELRDTYGLAGEMLTALAAGCQSAGYDVILCPSPLFPDRAEHLLVPQLGLAFVTSTPALPYEGRPYRRVRLDAMVDRETLGKYKARLKFSRKIQSALLEEGIDALAQAKAGHDKLEALYNPHVDFQGVYRQADQITGELLSLI